MTKKQLVLGFSDTFDNCRKFFTEILSRKYEVIIDNDNPKYLIFGDPNFGQNHYRYDPSKVRKILYTGENFRPTYFTHDYAITFDMVNSPNHYRLPLYALEMWAIVKDNITPIEFDYLKGLHTRVDWEKTFESAAPQLSYLQSNGNSPIRNMMLDRLFKQYDISSGGPHRNTIGYIIKRNRNEKIEFLRKRKINIAIENGIYPGYVTEKILDAFYAHTLPLYLGSPLIGRDFNTECFIHIRDYQYNPSNDKNEIGKFLIDKKAWCDKMSKPRFTNDMLNSYTQFNNFLEWFDENVYYG